MHVKKIKSQETLDFELISIQDNLKTTENTHTNKNTSNKSGPAFVFSCRLYPEVP